MTRYKRSVKSEINKELSLMIEDHKKVGAELVHKDQAQLFQKGEMLLKPDQLQVHVCQEPQSFLNQAKERQLRMS
jgi:hypothetical protein